MSAPENEDWQRLRHLAAYLCARPRCVHRFGWGELARVIRVFVDSDWAGEKESARSTSGGMIFWGGHLVKSWSSTQKHVTLSSGEAELMAASKGIKEALGIQQMLA